MSIENGVFGSRASFKARCMLDYEKLGDFIRHCKGLNLKIVLTSGSFDILHPGHVRYLEKARECGDLLVVGVDSDTKIEERKHRPAAVPEMERLEMLAYQRPVDIVTLKTPEMPKWALVKVVQPDVLIRSTGSKGYSAEENEVLKEFCGEIRALEPQGTQSTSARIRKMYIHGAGMLATKIETKMTAVVPQIVESSMRELENG